MKYLICIIAILVFVFAPNIINADQINEEAKVMQLIREVKALDPAIVEVRPARIKQLSHPRFPLVWTPAITLGKPVSEAQEIKIAKQMAAYVVNFQGGVKVAGVHGGIITFFEGHGWNPRIGQVSYKILSHKPLKIEVWTGLQWPNKHGRTTCCKKGEKIGMIHNDQFVSQ